MKLGSILKALGVAAAGGAASAAMSMVGYGKKINVKTISLTALTAALTTGVALLIPSPTQEK